MISEFINRSQQIIPLINKKKTCTLPFFINKKQPVIHFVFIDIQIFQVTILKILIQNNKYSILSYKNSDNNSSKPKHKPFNSLNPAKLTQYPIETPTHSRQSIRI